MAPRQDTGPQSLVGTELSSVAFVRDYVEFHFDGPLLRSLTDPVVVTGQETVTCADVGWRDALCALIGATVLHVQVAEERSIEIGLGTDRRLVVPLTQDARVGPEAAHFMSDAWRGSGMWIF